MWKKEGCDLCVHEVDLHKAFTIFTGFFNSVLICEAKTTEAGRQPNFRTSKERKKEGTAPVLVHV